MAPRDRLTRSDLVLAAVAGAAGVLFFVSLGRLWPLAEMDLHVSDEALEAKARELLLESGFEVELHDAESALRVDPLVLDYLQRSFGEADTQRLIAAGHPVFWYEALLKRRGDPDRYWVQLHPGARLSGGILGWGRTVQEDAPASAVSEEAARELARATLESRLGVRPEGGSGGPSAGGAVRPGAAWREQGFYDQVRPARRDRFFVYERHLSLAPELRERLVVTVAGDRVTAVERSLVPPEAARRAARQREAPVVALQMAGFVVAALAVVGAFAVFLSRLRAGAARLGPAARWVAVIGLCFVATQALQSHRLLALWDPLWPRWVAAFESLGTAAAGGAWILLVLFVVIAAGDALDREQTRDRVREENRLGTPEASREPAPEAEEGARGASLWAAGRGRLAAPAVGLASLRGFLVGLLCGGVLAAAVLALERLAGAWSPIQPQGFFFYPLNSEAPALATLLYFLMVALVEELAYRFFGAGYLLATTGRRWLAVLAPAVLYGLTHTGLPFLPPAEPFWGRAVVFTLVGCVWGWAFLRYDALTVVLSHYTADLFIFSWPGLRSGDPALVAQAAATIAVPLLPAAIWLAWGRLRQPRTA
ncbi:MAG TPA: CPBP family intramembrane glutamic endopeptidase [Thermoanaerobaculia bacterium]|nr:CPBP family intramembrane glutamic endopeptidase [Thermoanaerobaculia bacterium]